MPLSMAEFLARLVNVQPHGDGRWMAQCPAHDDRRNSLSVKVGKKHPIVVYCHAGCQRTLVLDTLHLTFADISAPSQNGPRAPRTRSAPARTIVATYDYCGPDGALRYQVVRFDPKDFRQRRPDPDRPGEYLWNLDGIERVPYRLDEIQGWCRMGQTTVVIVEGEKDADALWDLGIPATTNAGGAGGWGEALSRWLTAAGVREVLVVPDNDEPGRAHAAQAIAACRGEGLVARLLLLDGLEAHGDASDFLAAQGGDAFRAAMVEAQTLTPLTAVHDAFRKWMGPEYDIEVLNVVLAAAAAHQLGGDPCWIMVVSGSGAAKTETVLPLEGAGAHVESIITNPSALLSASPRRDVARDATGGLLRKIGASGILVLKDMTTTLSKDKNARAELLAAFREMHDGRLSRLVGSEGGRRLDWAGRVTMIAACTTKWDHAHEAIAAMGDRFVIVRFDSRYGRHAAFEQAQENNGHEPEMRRELSAVVGRALAQVDPSRVAPLTPADEERLYELANLVTLVRTAVEWDRRDDVMEAHAPEMPTRFGKQLAQIVRGGMALGLGSAESMALAVRAATDSLPPLKWRVLKDVAIHPRSHVADVRRRLDMVHNTAKRTLEALMVLGLVERAESGDDATYSIKSSIAAAISHIDTNPVSTDAPF